MNGAVGFFSMLFGAAARGPSVEADAEEAVSSARCPACQTPLEGRARCWTPCCGLSVHAEAVTAWPMASAVIVTSGQSL